MIIRRQVIQLVSRIVAGILVVVFCIGIVGIFRFGAYVKDKTGITPFTTVALLLDGESMIHTNDGRVNILLLGIGGGTHDGADLTDTIIVASFHIKNKSLALISIPRDLWSDTLKDKINSAYHYGEEKRKGGGIPLTKAIVEDVIGIPIHYSMVYDFSQFASTIDSIGGIDVSIESSFTDDQYPIAGKENDLCDGDMTYACRYESVHFEKGTEHMNGTRALQYVRSRHAEGNEGNDFARGKRQQEVILALKERIYTLAPWFHPKQALELFGAFDKATDSDMTVAQLIVLGKIMMRLNNTVTQRISIEPYLIEAPLWQYERYVLEPEESYEDIQTFIRTSLGIEN